MNKDLLVDGRLLISAKNASKRFGYTPDYISQLARSGTIPGRLLGRTWYVDLEALKQHKLSKLGTQKPEKPTFEIQTPSTPTPAIHHEPLPPVSLPELTKKPIPSQWDLNPLVIRHTLVSFFSILIIAGSALFWTNHFAPALSTKTLDTLSGVGEKQEELFASALNTTKLPYQKLLASGFFSDVAGGIRLVTDFISSRLFSNNTKLTLEPKYIELDDLNIIRDNLRDELLGYVPTSTPQTAPAQPVIVYQSVPIQNTIIAERVVETIYRDFHRQTDRNVDLIPQAINKLQYNGEFFDTTLNGAVITLSTTTQATTTDLYAENLTVLGADFTNLSFSQATGTSATTTNFFSSLASSTNLFATTANLGTLTLGALTNGLTISGNDAGITFSGTGNHDIAASSGTLRIGSNVIIGSIEALDNTIDIGTPGTRFDKIYANEINATTLVGTLTGGNLTAETFNINSDNATADTEDAYLSFERGTESPNALIKWDSTNKLFDFNNPIKVNGTLLITSSTTLQNFTFQNATGTSATTTNLYSSILNAGRFTVSGDDSELLKIENPSGGPERTLRFMVKNGFSPSLSRNIRWNGSSWVNDSAGVGAAAILFDSAAGNIELATTDQNSTLPVTRLTVKDSGNVGIGTSAPGEKLEVVGNIISKGTSWTSRTSVGGTWFNVAYGNGTFVAVTSNGVMTSPDGINWTSRTPASSNDWYGITYGNGLFVAVAQSGTGNRVMTSPDGITWTARTSASDSLWTNVAYGNGTFVAIGFTGEVMTSPDAITWTTRSASDSNVRFGLTYGNGLFVAVSISGSGSDVMTSPDGITWTARTTPTTNSWSSVTYGNGLFVAVAQSGTGNRVMTSPDGITWTARTSAADNDWRSVSYGNGLFVAVSSTGSGNRVMTSPDGITWTTRTSAANNFWRSVSYGNGVFVAVAQDGSPTQVMTSGKPESNLVSTGNIFQGDNFVMGKLGIGTTTPTRKLSVEDTSNAQTYLGSFINWSTGGSATAGIQIGKGYGADQSGVIQYNNTDNYLGFHIAGDSAGSALNIADGGNVGIGEIAPQSRLSVEISDSNTTQASGAILTLANADTTANNLTSIAFSFNAASANSFSRIGVINTDRTSSSEDQDIFFGTLGGGSYSEKMRITSAGYVGIGTTSPTSLLNVENDSTTGTASDNALAVIRSKNRSATIQMDAVDSASGFAGVSFAAAGTEKGRIQMSNSNYSMNFKVLGTEYMTILSNGNVGIGTTTPMTGYKLNIYGSTIHEGASGVSDIWYDETDTNYFAVTKRASGSAGNGNVGNGGVELLSYNNNLGLFTFGVDKSIQFYTNGANERMRIDPSGNVGIGTSTPSFTAGSGLHVVRTGGTSTVRIERSDGSAGALEFRSGQSSAVIGTTGNMILSFITNATTQATIDASGNLGIGTTAPGRTSFDANSKIVTIETNSANRAGVLELIGLSGANVGAGNPTGMIRFGNNISGTGDELAEIRVWNSDATNQNDGYLSLMTADAGVLDMRLTVSNTGNVGIGTTTPIDQLTIYGATNPRIGVNAPAGTSVGLNLYEAQVTKWTVGKDSNNKFLIARPGSPDFYIDTAGNVGIGTTTPGARLEVKGTGTGSFMAGAWGGDAAYGGFSVNGNIGLGANMYSPYGGTTLYINRPTGGVIRFREENGSDQMSILSGGNLAIGTSTSEGILSVKGSSGSTNYIRLMNDATNNDVIRLTDCGTGIDSGIIALKDGGTTKVNLVGDDDSASCGYSYFNAGNVGIGDTSPAALLTVGSGDLFQVTSGGNVSVVTGATINLNGVGGNTKIYAIGGSGQAIQHEAGGTATMYEGAWTSGSIQFPNIGTGTGSNYLCVDTSSSNLVLRGNGAACTASSLRFKENIVDLGYGLEEVLALRPVTYNYKAEANIGPGTKLGFIAEEMELVIPEVVTYDNEGRTFGLDYPVLTAVLTKAVQELNTKIESIELNLANASTSLTISTSTPGFLAAVYEAFGATVQNAIVYLKDVVIERLTVGKQEAPAGITLYDKATGAPYCFEIVNGNPSTTSGACGTQTAQAPSSGGGSSSPAPAPEPEPVASSTEPTASSTEPTASSTPETASSTPVVEEPAPAPETATSTPTTEPAPAPEPVPEPAPEPAPEVVANSEPQP